MATIKSFTDLEQSKKLVEILPIESADMWWSRCTIIDFDDGVLKVSYAVEPCNISQFRNTKEDIPCWSLVALFNVMPQINDGITPHGHKNDKLSQFEPKICKIWEHSIIPSYKVTYGNGLSTDIYDNPVDAAFEMILKLHELGIL